MTLHAIAALLWCFALFFSLAGWGFLVASRLRFTNHGFAIAVALGLAVQCLLGSLLNAVHLIRAPVLLGVVAIGIIATAYHSYHQPRRIPLFTGSSQTGRSRFLFYLVVAIIALHLVSFIRPAVYSPWDDRPVYLALPLKMLQLYHFAADPFSQRRITGSLGFNFYLQDLLLVLFPVKNLALVDGGLGVLLLSISSLSLSRVLKLTNRQAIAFLFLAGLMRQIFVNLSFVWLPCGIYLALTLIASRQDLNAPSDSPSCPRSLLRPLCLGAVGASAGALKNTHLVFVVLFVVAFHTLLAFLPRSPLFPAGAPAARRVLFFAQSIGVSALAALAVLSLWMIDLHHYAGTFFFPLLGHGFEYTSYGLLPTRAMINPIIVVKSLLVGLPLLLLAAIESTWVKWSLLTVACVAMTIASGLSTIFISLATGADSVRRYCYPQMMIALLLAFPLVCHVINAGVRMPRAAHLLKAAVVASILAGYLSNFWTLRFGTSSFADIADHLDRDLLASLRNQPLDPPSTIAEYRDAERSLPGEAVVLACVAHSYLLDNHHATYFEASQPAMASPPPAPGWPIFADGQALGAWLLQHNVRYLMVTFKDRDFVDMAQWHRTVNDPNETVILHSTHLASILAYRQYDQLAATRQHLFDGADLTVLDLATPATQQAGPRERR